MRVGNISALAAISALLAVAIAFALWADVLKTKIEVSTGDVDIKFVGDPSAFEPFGEYEGKDVGSCTASYEQLQDEDRFASDLLGPDWNSGSANDDLELSIVIDNAYPGYSCKVDGMSVENTGTVPVIVITKLTDEDGNLIRPEIVDGRAYIDVDGDGCYDFDLDYSSFFTLNETQLEPGDSKTFSVVVRVPTEYQECVEESHRYVFHVIIIGYQWNEAPG